MKPAWMAELKSAYHGVFGIPDYDAYLKHMGARHPGDPVLSQKAFSRWRIDCRYGAMRPRCC
jgi:uncharacterized short protein YbdD (DUF466 family)